MRPLIYVAGPYTEPDPFINTRAAIACGEMIEREGATPFIPHLSMLWHLIRPADITKWYARDLEVLDHCDGLYRFPGASKGADREVLHAQGIHLPVFRNQYEVRGFVRMRNQLNELAKTAYPEVDA